jgi:hypothetical protein
MDLLRLSSDIENLLVQKNVRRMAELQPHLTPGYYLRAAQLLADNKKQVVIATGFPVAGRFETDGPIGAIALYMALQKLGVKPVLVCEQPLYSVLSKRYSTRLLDLTSQTSLPEQIAELQKTLEPSIIVSIERPGLTSDNTYQNMIGENITAQCWPFDLVVQGTSCPVLAIGDGGNELGMGKVQTALEKMQITPSLSSCDELLIADVSNWGCYGLIAMLSLVVKQNLLADFNVNQVAEYLSQHGSVDGVTRQNTLSEDSFELSEGETIIRILSDWVNHSFSEET